jgi:hypothetical protein
MTSTSLSHRGRRAEQELGGGGYNASVGKTMANASFSRLELSRSSRMMVVVLGGSRPMCVAMCSVIDWWQMVEGGAEKM